jgi:thiosulfate/3-mercaptopyruvate sulfurtransferase
MGHKAAAVLDGGWSAWRENEYPVRNGMEKNEPGQFQGSAREEMLVLLDEVDSLPLLIDSRAAERYRGEIEPIDPVAGHIPGAINFFYQRNWDDIGRYLSREDLKRQFSDLLGDTPAEEATFHCGSGVTACANLLALAHAGLGDGRLYVGSWSEWCSDPVRPVARSEP